MVVDILHPNRANISKDELRQKLAELYKASKDQVNVFGLQTQFGGGKTTGFALIYDSPEALKKFEPHYRLVRVGVASKIEKPSRQQRKLFILQILDVGVDREMEIQLGWCREQWEYAKISKGLNDTARTTGLAISGHLQLLHRGIIPIVFSIVHLQLE